MTGYYAGLNKLLEGKIQDPNALINPTKEWVANRDNFQQRLTQSILFGFGRTDLKEESEAQLTQIVSAARKESNYAIEVRGFTDSIGSADYNLLRLAKYSDIGTRTQHAVPLRLEHDPCHHNLRDSVGLSRARADSVARNLTAVHQIPLFRMYRIGLGEAPAADNETPEGRHVHRRVDIILYATDFTDIASGQ